MARESMLDNDMARRTFNILGWAFAIAVPMLIVSASYFQMPLSLVFSFRVDDGWCEPATEGIRLHCFGDFQLPRVLLTYPTQWNGGYTGYAPTGMWPHVAARWLERAGLGVRGSLIVYLLVVGACVLSPAVWTARRLRDNQFPGVVFALLGAMTLPFFNIMDRGNSMGLAVPVLLAFFVTLHSPDRRLAPIFLVLAAMIRPQLAVVGLALLVVDRRRELYAAVAGFIGVSVLSFIQWTGNPWSDFRVWLNTTYEYATYQPLNDDFPVNISMARTIFLALRGLDGMLGGSVGAIDEWLVRNTFPVTAAMGAVTVGVILWRGRQMSLMKVAVLLLVTAMIAPSTTYPYYLVLSLVIAALFVVGPWPEEAMDSADGTGSSFDKWWNLAIIAALVVSLVPIAVRLNPGHQSIGLEAAGPLWAVVWVLTVVGAMRDRAPRQNAVRSRQLKQVGQ